MEFAAATSQDASALDRFLVGHADTSMFLRSNLRAFGPCGGEDRNATRMWMQTDHKNEISGVIGLSNAGFVLSQLPDFGSGAAVRAVLAGEEVRGIIGASEQVHALRDTLDLLEAPANLDEDEPLYSLDLADLIVPAGETALRKATEADRELAEAWRRDYLIETIHFSEDEARDLAPTDIDGMLERGTLMFQVAPDGTPVSMTSFNAILPDMVQIGNVYTPPAARGRGLARRCVALHLELARSKGTERAILFASGPSASRAYEAIGFRRIGSFTLLLFEDGHKIAVAA